MPVPTRVQREAALREQLAERILVLDGATGTALQDKNLTADDFGGEQYEGCNEQLNLTRPDVVLDVHRLYLEAGADIVETNTFGATPLVLAEYQLEARTEEINHQAAALARQACDEFSTSNHPRFVAGSMGPTTKAISVTGGVSFDALIEHYRCQAVGLMTGGADYLLLETAQDTRNIKAGLLGIEGAFEALGYTIPVAVSGTIEATGTMLAGQGVEALYTSLMHWPLLYLGLNCATGPELMTDHLRSLAALSSMPIACVPNAGLPDEDGCYLETPAMLADSLERFMQAGWINLVGGCCGTTPAHIQALVAAADRHRPHRPLEATRSIVSGIDHLELSEDNRPVLVGERTNVLGSRKFKRLIAAGEFDKGAEIARRQVKGGAQVIDVGLADPDRDEVADIHRFLSILIQKIKVPLMIDSTDAAVVETALTYCQGKAIINSINLEDGEARFQEIAPLARRFGAALVVGCIDEDPDQGMAVTRARKLEVARRSAELLIHTYGIPEADLIFDPLVFPCATGVAEYVGSAVETLEGLRLIKEAFPAVRTVLGISNVSFGLPAEGREVLNSVFLYHCTKAGLDMAIVNTEKLERYASISEEERDLSEALLWNRGEDPVAAFAAHFKGVRRKTVLTEALPLDERLRRYIIEGVKDGLAEDLERKRAETSPLNIINGPLMEGMAEVGRLFNNNELIVAEVLQSAEAMKAAVTCLEPFMEKGDSAGRGKLLLATVKGDVHDIGKNLVDIIFSNNGYSVINLGIKVAPQTLLEAWRAHTPTLIGLSGLLVKSAQQMVVTAQDLKNANISTPILVGGAALSRRFVDGRIAPAYEGLVVYANDAMSGLELANGLTDPTRRPKLEADTRARQQRVQADRRAAARPSVAAPSSTTSTISRGLPIPQPPDLDRHVLRRVPLHEVWRFLNPQMLYAKHLGFRGNILTALDAGDSKALELETVVKGVQQICVAGAMEVSAVYRFFSAESRGNHLTLFGGGGTPAATFEFPRQGRAPHLCLADYCLMARGDTRDHLALFVTSAGRGIRELAEKWKQDGDYLRCHVLQALALETAEAAAEWLHQRLRRAWGVADAPDLTMADLHRARYRGKRFSFGYPACPELADQEKLFALLTPEDVGVRLTEGFMMEPEASVSAMVFHHPEARYFAIR